MFCYVITRTDVTRLPRWKWNFALIVAACLAGSWTQAAEESVVDRFVTQYCVDCHDRDTNTAGLDLNLARSVRVESQPNLWERVVRKLEVRHMPPADMSRPDDQEYEAVLASLTETLDRQSAQHPQPGRTPSLRRLTRTEYQNAIRDLLDLEIDVTTLLPPDDSSHGFDNVTVGDLSPSLLDRYLSAAEKISRLAIGSSQKVPGGETIRLRADVTQEEHVAGLPLGTRGGTAIRHQFPQNGEYEIQVRLARDRNEEVEGLYESHELEILLDRKLLSSFTVSPPPGRRDFESVDRHLLARIPVTAGPHMVGVTFLKNPSALLETKRQPYQAHFNMHRHPRISPAVYQVSITGPFAPQGAGDTPSRRRIFICTPGDTDDEERCAREIIAALMRRAYRRPVSDTELQSPLALYQETRHERGFEAGIEMALSAILVNPQFLFRVEQDPDNVAPQTPYALSSLELATRLSLFLWSSIPDEELLDVAARGELVQAEVLERQARRMLADPRSNSLVTNFAGQWLHLRNLDSITPDLRLFPDFDDNLRQAFRRETELLFERVLREDRSVLELLRADYTHVNERLAKHYGISHIYGSRFRRVDLRDSERGGLLRQGSILTVTSYATRTSPVIRGKWILENLFATPPPPPPANVPALKDNTVAASLSVRERLAEHRANAACASCHNLMDPVGLSLENFDAVGRFRLTENGHSIDASGGLPDGRSFRGVAGLEQALLERPDLFITAMVEKMLTFALGRGVEPADGPAIRTIVRESRAVDDRFSSLVVGIVHSIPFRMRNTE